MIKSWIAAGFLAVVASVSHAAGSSELKSLITGSDNRGWEAVGRLNFARQSFCTGALIEADLVLTAAHCLFDRDSGRRFDVSEIEFLAGWRNGRANAKGRVARAIVHPAFDFQGQPQDVRVAFDLALLRLTQPIRKTSVVPFETQSRPRKGQQVGVVSYGHDRPDSPALQEVCHVLARRSGTLILSCEVESGSSGAPIFTVDDAGVARIVSVVSAMARIGERDVSLGTSLEKPLADLMALMANSDTAPQSSATGVRVLNLGGTDGNGGAKFVRP